MIYRLIRVFDEGILEAVCYAIGLCGSLKRSQYNIIKYGLNFTPFETSDAPGATVSFPDVDLDCDGREFSKGSAGDCWEVLPLLGTALD